MPFTEMNSEILESLKTEIKLRAIKILKTKVSQLVEILRKFNLLYINSGIHNVQTDKNSDFKCILLSNDITNLEEIFVRVKDNAKHDLLKNLLMFSEFIDYNVVLDYKRMNLKMVFDMIFPNSIEKPFSFETIGHIAHFNLKPEWYEHKSIIGKAVLDKNKHIKTVVHKSDKISNSFRNFDMEVIAGCSDFITLTKESGSVFKLDYSKVFWNSRLSHEHERVVFMLSKDDVVFDMFSGVGPFAIPAAKRGCTVHANDLNIHSYKYLLENVQLNKLNEKVIKCYNFDARVFFETTVLPIIEATHSEDENKKFFCIMNYPAFALDFLDLFNRHFLGKNRLTILCHCFSSEMEKYEQNIITRAKKNVNFGKNYKIVLVRKVSPRKQIQVTNNTNAIKQFIKTIPQNTYSKSLK